MSAALILGVLLPSWAYLVASVVAARRFGRDSRAEPTYRPPVTVLKPLHGVEPGLRANLRSFVEQDYPRHQIVLGVRHPRDRALPIARMMQTEFADRDIAMVVDPRASGTNLKVANLENMMPAARHDILVFADSDMRVGRDYLAAVTAPLADPATGIVTCLYRGVPTGGLWSELGAMHINYGFLPGALVGEAIGVGRGCFGATIALRRTVFDQIGGFTTLRDELADDHRLGRAVAGLDLGTVLARYLVDNQVTEPSFSALWRHELRWARTVRAMEPVGFAGSLVTHTIVLSLVIALIAGFDLTSAGFVAMSWLLRWVAAFAVARYLRLPSPKPWLLPLRDALSFGIFLASFLGRNVHWRDQRLRVASDGRMTGANPTVDGDRSV